MSRADCRPKRSTKDAEHLIAALSEQLHIPAKQVGEIYWKQLDLLTAQARIHDFVGVLALRNARAILRPRGARKDSNSS
jgi:hypothetical protein